LYAYILKYNLNEVSYLKVCGLILFMIPSMITLPPLSNHTHIFSLFLNFIFNKGNHHEELMKRLLLVSSEYFLIIKEKIGLISERKEVTWKNLSPRRETLLIAIIRKKKYKLESYWMYFGAFDHSTNFRIKNLISFLSEYPQENILFNYSWSPLTLSFMSKAECKDMPLIVFNNSHDPNA